MSIPLNAPELVNDLRSWIVTTIAVIVLTRIVVGDILRFAYVYVSTKTHQKCVEVRRMDEPNLLTIMGHESSAV